MTVSLKDFVSQTLRDILDGVMDVQKDANLGKHIAPWGIGSVEYPSESGAVRKGPFTATVVKFDVAVTAELTDSAKAGSGLKIAVFDFGVQGEIGSKNVATNRIQFSVPVSLPAGDGDPASYAGAQSSAGEQA
jgi:hypothetical protein